MWPSWVLLSRLTTVTIVLWVIWINVAFSYTLYFSRSERLTHTRWQAEGHLKIWRHILRSSSETGERDGPTASYAAGSDLRSHHWCRYVLARFHSWLDITCPCLIMASIYNHELLRMILSVHLGCNEYRCNPFWIQWTILSVHRAKVHWNIVEYN